MNMNINNTKQVNKTGSLFISRGKERRNNKIYPAGLTQQEYVLLNKIAHIEHVHRGEVLFEEGEKDDHLYIICSGHVKMGHRQIEHKQWVDFGLFGVCDMDDLNEKEVIQWRTVHTMNPGECIGEINFIRNGSHSLTAQASSEGDVLVVNATHLLDVVAQHPEMGEHLCKALEKSCRKCT